MYSAIVGSIWTHVRPICGSAAKRNKQYQQNGINAKFDTRRGMYVHMCVRNVVILKLTGVSELQDSQLGISFALRNPDVVREQLWMFLTEGSNEIIFSDVVNQTIQSSTLLTLET